MTQCVCMATGTRKISWSFSSHRQDVFLHAPVYLLVVFIHAQSSLLFTAMGCSASNATLGFLEAEEEAEAASSTGADVQTPHAKE